MGEIGGAEKFAEDQHGGADFGAIMGGNTIEAFFHFGLGAGPGIEEDGAAAGGNGEGELAAVSEAAFAIEEAFVDQAGDDTRDGREGGSQMIRQRGEADGGFAIDGREGAELRKGKAFAMGRMLRRMKPDHGGHGIETRWAQSAEDWDLVAGDNSCIRQLYIIQPQDQAVADSLYIPYHWN